MRRVLAPGPTLALALVWPLLLAVGALGTTGCGADAADPDDDAGVMVEITLDDGEAEVSDRELAPRRGEEVELVVMADGEGEIHVRHADGSVATERYTYEPGTTTFAFTVDEPGTVDVELHHPRLLLTRLEVR